MLIFIINPTISLISLYNHWIKIDELVLLFALMDLPLSAEFVHHVNHHATPAEVQLQSVLIVCKIKIKDIGLDIHAIKIVLLEQ
jgi:hypothetical protein